MPHKPLTASSSSPQTGVRPTGPGASGRPGAGAGGGSDAVAVPEDDKGLMTRSEMIARLVFAMGGRAAEELVFREPTTGAVSDIEQATLIAIAQRRPETTSDLHGVSGIGAKKLDRYGSAVVDVVTRTLS